MKKVILKTLAVLCAVAICSGAWADKKNKETIDQKDPDILLPYLYYQIVVSNEMQHIVYVQLDSIQTSRSKKIKRFKMKQFMTKENFEIEYTNDIDCSLHLQRQNSYIYYGADEKNPSPHKAEKEWDDIFEGSGAAKVEDIVCQNIKKEELDPDSFVFLPKDKNLRMQYVKQFFKENKDKK